MVLAMGNEIRDPSVELPFDEERAIGYVSRVDGSTIHALLPSGHQLPKNYFGRSVSMGGVGEFVVIEAMGQAIFGRISSVGVNSTIAFHMSEQKDQREPIIATIDLLASLTISGQPTKGIVCYPRVHDRVYFASDSIVERIVDLVRSDDEGCVELGRVKNGNISVALAPNRVFGRHLAIVGSTGSGKSWTLAHIAEEVSRLGGKLILVDATGEFATLGPLARHLVFSSPDEEPADTELICMPHYLMRESDLYAFFNPSSGVQLPKLREAVRTLKLVRIKEVHELFSKNIEDEALCKTGIDREKYNELREKYSEECRKGNAEYNVRALSRQIEFECIYQDGGKNARGNFGGFSDRDLGHVGPLVSRINDVLQNDQIMEVISPKNATIRAFGDVLEDWLKNSDLAEPPVLRISLRNLTFANHLREIVVNIIGNELLSRARANEFRKNPLVIALDEAHQFFNVTVEDGIASAKMDAFDLIAKEGRKYGLTSCLVTQRPSDLPNGVLSQVGMIIVHRLADERDRRKIEQAATELDGSATKLLPGLVPGEAILVGAEFPIPVSIQVSKPRAQPSSDGPNYSFWATEKDQRLNHYSEK